jgi:hypothetical protein
MGFVCGVVLLNGVDLNPLKHPILSIFDLVFE